MIMGRPQWRPAMAFTATNAEIPHLVTALSRKDFAGAYGRQPTGGDRSWPPH